MGLCIKAQTLVMGGVSRVFSLTVVFFPYLFAASNFDGKTISPCKNFQ